MVNVRSETLSHYRDQICPHFVYSTTWLQLFYYTSFLCPKPFVLQWNLSITTTEWDTSLLSGADLGSQGPPIWAPEIVNTSELVPSVIIKTHYWNKSHVINFIIEVVITDRFHCITTIDNCSARERLGISYIIPYLMQSGVWFLGS